MERPWLTILCITTVALVRFLLLLPETESNKSHQKCNSSSQQSCLFWHFGEVVSLPLTTYGRLTVNAFGYTWWFLEKSFNPFLWWNCSKWSSTCISLDNWHMNLFSNENSIKGNMVIVHSGNFRKKSKHVHGSNEVRKCATPFMTKISFHFDKCLGSQKVYWTLLIWNYNTKLSLSPISFFQFFDLRIKRPISLYLKRILSAEK